MKIKEKITNMVNTFIADPENAEKAYYKKPAHWSSSDIHIFWSLIAQNEKIRPIYETAGEFLDYLIENETVTPEDVAEDFKEWYKDNGYCTDIGLTTFCENHLTYNFYAEDIDTETDEELYEKVDEAENLWYWHKILELAAQNAICCGDFFENVVECL